MRLNACGLLLLAMLSGCGIEGAIRRNDDRYMQPGALDGPLTGYYDTYQFRFLDKYRISQTWPVISSCDYRSLPTLGRRGNRYMGEIYAGKDIYESDGKTWIRFEGITPFDFDSYVRSVKWVSKERGKEGEILEVGLKPMCGETWWKTSHFLTAFLHKRDLATWRAQWTERNPKGKWSERQAGTNTWLVQETAEQDFSRRPMNGVGGPFQTWLLPIGDTGYTLALELGASQESLQYPEAHAQMQTAFRHLLESVRIDPLTPEVEAEMKQLHAQAKEVQRMECIKNAKYKFEWCKKYLVVESPQSTQ